MQLEFIRRHHVVTLNQPGKKHLPEPIATRLAWGLDRLQADLLDEPFDSLRSRDAIPDLTTPPGGDEP
jgi:hypothetical protein